MGAVVATFCPVSINRLGSYKIDLLQHGFNSKSMALDPLSIDSYTPMIFFILLAFTSA